MTIKIKLSCFGVLDSCGAVWKWQVKTNGWVWSHRMKGIGMKNYKGARCLVSSEQHKKNIGQKRGGVLNHMNLELGLVCRMVIGFLNSRCLVSSRAVSKDKWKKGKGCGARRQENIFLSSSCHKITYSFLLAILDAVAFPEIKFRSQFLSAYYFFLCWIPRQVFHQAMI